MNEPKKRKKLVNINLDKSFGSYMSAYATIAKDFDDEVRLLRLNRSITDEKLETHTYRDERGIPTGFYFAGKVKFSDKTILEEEGEEDLVGTYITITQYTLRQKSPKIRKESEPRKENWILEKIVVGDARGR
ncbi:hypothetical protein GOV14_02195 [Candidatus Pacearchaeota archaeon]|nr:hypothetical protein [Candidatus Pacearchaeota archaeon]